MAGASTVLDATVIRSEFPVVTSEINGKPLVYLDSANTSQKPNIVIDTMANFMRESYAPINRSAYTLAANATELYEGSRVAVAKFINANNPREIVFTKNATEALNLIAYSWGRANLQRGDVVLLTHMEHHANIVPWQMLQQERGIELRWVPLTSDFQLDLSSLPTLLKDVKVFSFTAMSHAAGAIAIVDACQSVPHSPTDVQALGADFAMFSSHKMCGPSGLGVLWGREALLEAMPPFMGGGNMISEVRLDGFKCAELPAKFEAGTPAIVEVVGLGAAVEFLNGVG
ncbi:MAG: hypothetical protein RLZZ534_556, partial [Actinomycetota bacterium]